MEVTVLTEQRKAAVDLDQRIKTTAKALAENLFELCGMFYKMSSEKLYKELGYQNFAEYCENEVGIKRFQGAKYAKIGETFCSENVKSTIHFESFQKDMTIFIQNSNRKRQNQMPLRTIKKGLKENSTRLMKNLTQPMKKLLTLKAVLLKLPSRKMRKAKWQKCLSRNLTANCPKPIRNTLMLWKISVKNIRHK